MSTSESFRAFRANPRNDATFPESVENVAGEVRARVATSTDVASSPRPRRRVLGASAAAAAVAAAGVAAFLTIGSPSGGPEASSATAAIERAATVAQPLPSSPALPVVRITHDGEPLGRQDGSVERRGRGHCREGAPVQARGAGEMRVVDELYGPDADGSWLMLGSPSNIDPDSGTTPAEYLAAVREDVGGALPRVARGAARRLTSRLADGSSVYTGTVPAGAIARRRASESQHIRVLPFGYVARDEAENPQALLDTEVTVGSGGVRPRDRRDLGTWRYTVAYDNLGATAADAGQRATAQRAPEAVAAALDSQDDVPTFWNVSTYFVASTTSSSG